MESGARAREHPLVARTARLLTALSRDDGGAIRSLYAESFAGDLNPRRLSQLRGPARETARIWFESWDEVLRTRVLSPQGDAALLSDVMIPKERGFGMGLLLLNGFWLQRVGTALPEDPVALADDFAELALDGQARALGAALFRAHARCALDYPTVAEQLPPEILPALSLWFLGGYLTSPLTAIDPVVRENRARAVEGFCCFHHERELVLPSSTIFGASAFAVTSYAEEPRAFLETLSERLLAPTLSHARPARRMKRRKRSERRSELGLVLSAWNEDAAVYRCMSPVVRGMQASGACGIRLGAKGANPGTLPAAWRQIPIHAVADQGIPELRRAMDRIRRLGLDFLMYPEVGLSNTRWLATQRLARVQAAGYGHPVTTGCRAIDYFVGGEAVERDGRDYRERLVLLPGLGVASQPPLAPSQPRSRPTDGRDVRLVTLASFNKLSSPLLETLGAVMRDSGSDAQLQMVPGLTVTDCPSLVEELAPFFSGARVELKSMMPRRECVDLLAEADVYLDSFPFGGYNTVVEALCAGCPVVTLEGQHAYGRFAAGALRMLGLPEWLIAKTPAEYVAAVRRLVREPALRAELRAGLDRERVVQVLCGDDLAAHFDAAVAWMREQGPENPGPPVLIRAGEAARVLDQR